MKRKITMALLLCLFMGFTAYAEETSQSAQLFCMDTVMSLTAYGPHAEEGLEKAEKALYALDAMLSTENETSEIAKLNAMGSAELSEEAVTIVRKGLEVSAMTEGAFDFTVYPLMKLWGFMTDAPALPKAEDIETLLPFVDASRPRLEGNILTLGEGQEIDLGGIAKGYASAMVMDIFAECGIQSAVVSLGGNCQVLGEKPNGAEWKIGIRDPHPDSGEIAAILRVRNCAVITSGGYERYFEQDGETYIHILDPKTGYPVRNTLASVTIVSEDGALADALATALFIMGEKDAVSFWQEKGEGLFEIVLIRKDGSMVVSEGLRDCFSADAKTEFVQRG